MYKRPNNITLNTLILSIDMKNRIFPACLKVITLVLLHQSKCALCGVVCAAHDIMQVCKLKQMARNEKNLQIFKMSTELEPRTLKGQGE